MNLFKLLLPITFTLVVSSCATLSEDECLTVDWAAIGFEDGADGRPAQRIREHREACAKYGVTPDRTAYNQGREEGLAVYCRPAHGYALGLKGKQYNGVCPRSLDAEFTEAYEQGLHLYRLQQNVYALQSDINSAEEQIHDIEHRLEELEDELVNGETTAQQRKDLLSTSKELSEQLGTLKSELRNMRNFLGRAQYELDLYRNTHTPNY